jgi:hypothetical protein
MVDEKPEISRAPRPIEPVRGTSSFSQPANQPADWEEWQARVSAELWEAVALAHNIEPSTLPRDWRYGDSSGTPAVLSRALRIACDHAKNGQLPHRDDRNFIAGNIVVLHDFAAWAETLGWELPAKFPRKPKAPPIQPNGIELMPARRDMIDAAISEVDDEAEAQRKKPPNLNELVKPVQRKLRDKGRSASKTSIQTAAEEPKHANRRGRVVLKYKGREF